MALIILNPARIVRNPDDQLLYFVATYYLTEAIGGTDNGEIFVPVGSMADSDVATALKSAAATHANEGTGGSFTPDDVRLGVMSGGLASQNVGFRSLLLMA